MIKLNIRRFAVTSGTVNSSYYYTSVPKTNWYVQVNWWVTATGSNYHTIKAEFYAKNTNSLSSANYCYLYNYKAVINGSTFGNGTSKKGYHGLKLGETTVTIYHTGEQSFSISCEGYYEGKAAKNKVSGSATFTLPALIATPVLAWNSYSAGSETSINFSASVTSNGNASIVNNYVNVSTTSNMSNIVKTASSLNSAVTGLSPNTTYYLRARASNGTYTGYSSVVSVTTWANPSVKSISAWNVGGSTTIQFNNAHGRTLNWYIKAGSTSGTTLASGTTTGTSVTVTPNARTCWSSITSGNSKTAYLYFTCSNPNITSGSVTATYTLQKVNAGTMTVKHSNNTNNTYGVGATNVVLTLGDAITIPISSNASKANYKWFIETPDGQHATYGTVDTNQGTTTQTISAATIQSIITNYFTAQMASDVATQGVNIGIATLNGNNSIIMNSEYFGNIRLTNEQIKPTFSNWSYYDANNTITGITGNNQILIQNASYPALKITTANLPQPKYGASLSYIAITLGNRTIKYTPSSWTNEIVYNYNQPITSANGQQNVTVSIYDSRGAHTDVTKQLYIVPYVKPVDQTTITRKNSFETETTISVKGKYSSAYKQDGSSYFNSITGIRYRYKLSTASDYGSWTTLSTISQTHASGLSASSYSVANIVDSSTFDNNNQYNFQVEITDTFGNVTVNTIILDKGVPIMFINTTSENVGIGTRNESGNAYSLATKGNIYPGGQVIKNGGSSWIKARDVATVRNNNTTQGGAYYPVVSQKTKDGEWSIGQLSGENNLTFSYTTDTNYNNNNNTSVRWTIDTSGVYSGTSAIANKLGTATKGSATKPIYLNAGVPTEGTAIGAAGYKGVKTLSAAGNTGWTNQTDGDAYVVTKAFMTYWNGRYNGSNSNLTYAHQGTIQCKPTNLYNNTSGNSGTVTLSQSAANFTYLDIVYTTNGKDVTQIHRIWSPNGRQNALSISHMYGGNTFETQMRHITISGTSITNNTNTLGYIWGGEGSIHLKAQSVVHILRVDGWK